LTLDPQTLIVVLAIAGVLQFIGLLGQHLNNKTENGPGWWAAGTAFTAVGYIFSPFHGSATPFQLFATFANNLFVVIGAILIYIGVQRFFGRRENRVRLLLVLGFSTLFLIYFTYVYDDINARRITLSTFILFFSFLIAHALLHGVPVEYKSAARFVAIFFIANGFSFILRAAVPLFHLTENGLPNEIAYKNFTALVILMLSSLWTFGLINLVSQHLIIQSHQSNAYIENILNYANAPIIVWNPQFLVTRFNHAFENLTGRSEAEMLGQSLEVLFPPSQAATSMNLIRETLKGMRWESVEIIIQHLDGSLRNVLWNSATLLAPDGNSTLATIAHGQDITARMQAESALRESEEKYRTLFRDSTEAHLIIVDGVIVDCNRATELLVQADRSWVIGKAPHELSPSTQPDGKSSLESAREKIELAIQIGSLRFEWIHQRADGVDFFADVAITSITLEGKPALFITWSDISARKLAEEALRASQLFLSDLIDNSGSVIYVKNLAGAYELVNKQWEITTYISREKALGHTDIELFPGETGQKFRQADLAVMENDVTREFEEIFPHADGPQYFLSVKFPLRDKNQLVRGLCGISHDITEMKLLQDKLKQQAITDSLTDVSNRRHFIELAQLELKRANRRGHPLAISLIDIDLFKSINDTYGHAGGDQALILLTRIFKKNIREIDVFARFGGDEFALLMPETNQQQAYEVLERVSRQLNETPLNLPGAPVTLSLSAGISALTNPQDTLDTLLEHADHALYTAKNNGRGLIETWQ
jgi:diguanylate cyclase (GGDEF)-like protein/PAS domain S-box-containing protein